MNLSKFALIACVVSVSAAIPTVANAQRQNCAQLRAELQRTARAAQAWSRKCFRESRSNRELEQCMSSPMAQRVMGPYHAAGMKERSVCRAPTPRRR